MPIYEDDHRLMQAEDMSQEDTGGGRQSARDVPGGQVGTLFAKLARLTFLGKWRAAKAYQWVATDTAEEAAEAHVVLVKRTSEPLVNVTLFRTGSHTDRLPAARSYVQSYQVAGVPAPMYLYGSAAAGQDVAVWWQRLDQAQPRVGDVVQLQAVNGGAVEACKIIRITAQEGTYYEIVGTSEVSYKRRLLTCKLYSPLKYSYTGHAIGRTDPSGYPLTRSMLTNGALRFYGVSQLAAAVDAGDPSVQVASVYSQMVPSVYSPTAYTNERLMPAGAQTFASGGISHAVSGSVHGRSILITQGNQDSLYVVPLRPLPAAGTALAAVRILGEWVSVWQDSSKNRAGMTLTVGEGGIATLSLGSAGFPDLDSYVIFWHASGIHFRDRAGITTVSPIAVPFAVAQDPQPGTVALAWVSGGTARSASVGADGQITGHCTGWMAGRSGVMFFSSNLPDAGGNVAVSYQPLTTQVETITPTMTGGLGALALSALARPGTIQVTWSVQRSTTGYAAAQSAAKVSTGSATVQAVAPKLSAW